MDKCLLSHFFKGLNIEEMEQENWFCCCVNDDKMFSLNGPNFIATDEILNTTWISYH